MKKVKYKRRKHQTDHTNLHILFINDPIAYNKLAKSMRWITAKL